jgi:hypothetical protein
MELVFFVFASIQLEIMLISQPDLNREILHFKFRFFYKDECFVMLFFLVILVVSGSFLSIDVLEYMVYMYNKVTTVT